MQNSYTVKTMVCYNCGRPIDCYAKVDNQNLCLDCVCEYYGIKGPEFADHDSISCENGGFKYLNG